MKIKLLTIVFVILMFEQSFSQACCSAGTPLSAQLGLSFLQKGEFLFNVAYDYNYLNDQFKNSEKLDIDSRARLSQNILTRIQYGISDRWALSLSISYVFRSEQTGVATSSFENLSSSGIGDLLLQTNFAIIDKNQHHFLLSGGLKMPTGSNSEENELGFPLPPDLQPGTGSWDGIFAALYEFDNVWDGHFHFNSSITARFNGEGSRFDGKQEFQFGNEYSFIIGLNYETLVKKSFIVPSLNLSYRRTMIDLTDGALTPNTGGDWLAIVPGLSFIYNDDISLLFSSSIPIFRYVEGTQLTTSYSFFIQFQYSLNTIKNEILQGF